MDTTQHHSGIIAARYRIIEKLGEGGMGVVYKAEDVTLGRPVALKFLHRELSADTRARARFLTEARTASTLEHPNICSVHEIGETDDGSLFIAMGYLEGESLRNTLQRGPLEHERAMEIMRQLARALRTAHLHGIVHGDIKPDNIFLLPDGSVKVLDFGLARFMHMRETLEGQTAGTLAYMAPEVLRNEEADGRADIWSIGVVLYEMLAGALPFPGRFPAAMSYSILNEPHPDPRTLSPRIREEICALIDLCLRKRPEDRPEDLTDPIRGVEETRSTAPPARPQRRRRIIAAGALVLLAVAAAYFYWRPGMPPEGSGELHIAVLPFTVISPLGDDSALAGTVQYILADALTGTPGITIEDPLSLNTTLGAVGASSSVDLHSKATQTLLAGRGITHLITGSIQRRDSQYTMQCSLVDRNGAVLHAVPRANVKGEDALYDPLRKYAGAIVDYLALNEKLKADSSFAAWISMRGKRPMAALKAFLSAREVIYRGEAAGEQLEEALANDSTFIAARIWYISHLHGTPNVKEMQRQYDILLRQRGDANPFEHVMIRYIGAVLRGDQPEQLRSLQLALQISPGNFILLLNLAELRFETGDYGGALEDVMPSVRARWAYAPVYQTAAACLMNLGKEKEAHALLRETWSLAKTYHLSWAMRAALYRRERQLDSAAEFEKRGIDICLERGYAEDFGCIIAARLYLAIGDVADAVVLARRAVTVAPDYWWHRMILGEALMKLGNTAEAQKELEKAAHLAPNAPRVQLLLAELHKSAGRVELAEVHYRRFFDLDSLSFAAVELAHRRYVNSDR
ncbi:MAG: protein kinase [Ignavibacteriae bacterium]|nr:protein kinase [Ignavibacteriota bacterium]